MKKAFLFIAAAMAIFAGCKKEQLAQALKSDNIIHIGVKQIAPATKVAADDITANKLSFKWEEGDQVAFDDNERIIIYTCTDPATGEFSGEALDPDATYWVEYPNGYSGTFIYRGNQIPKGHLIMNEEVSGSATTFTLDTHETIIHFKLKGAAKVGSIALSNGYAKVDYTLSCGDGVQLSDTATDFYMDAMYVDPHKLSSFAYTLRIYDTNNKELKSVSFHLKEENQETIVDFATPIEVNAAPSIPEGALPGVFSVSATKQVHFSQGNLVATINDSGAPTAWKFATNQYDCLGEGGANKTISVAEGDVDLFGWSTASTAYGISTSTSYSDYSGNFVDWGKAIDTKGTWRTLSNDEWCYLFAYDPGKYEFIEDHPRRQLFKYGVTVCGKLNCVVLLPDGWKWEGAVGTSWQSEYNETTTDVKWSTMETAGAVCLPAAGFRNGFNVDDIDGYGYYWSSTAYDEYCAYYVYFSSGSVFPCDNISRYKGLSVRLITDVN